MKVTINGKDMADVLSKFQDEHVRIEITSHNRPHKQLIVGTVRVEREHIEVPYNPDTDCGTDAIINKEVRS